MHSTRRPRLRRVRGLISALGRKNEKRMTACICSDAKPISQGVSVAQLPELALSLREISTDFKQWVTQFQCSVCGQRWEERYESKGQSNVPSVHKVTS